ncbi:hypothetical protein H3V53_34075 [Paraburkholderia bengalensis]|uniref:Uncharacterized protein n=1 Tax=Paraburkholderia bengalensis TaxID=2747562 RepID=A0ABU8J2U1_9BURK
MIEICPVDRCIQIFAYVRRILLPEELAAIHPRLYHITRPSALASISKHGLLPTSDLLALFELPAELKLELETRRRPKNAIIEHPVHGEATLTDNGPLSESVLSGILDDGLTASQWMRMLNDRVFFWPDEGSMNKHLAAHLRDGKARVVMVFDTLSLVTACYDRVQLCPIIAGSTIRMPVRRGLSTFSAVNEHTYREWQQLRGKRDRIKELVVRGSVKNIEPHLVHQYDVS